MKKKRGRPKKTIRPIEDDYLNVKQLADYLKISVSHIYTLTSNKKIPHIKLLGKKLLFDRKKINNWLEKKEVSVKK